jgi:hypothetical protein
MRSAIRGATVRVLAITVPPPPIPHRLPVTLAAPRAHPQMHPVIRRKLLEGQPTATTGTAPAVRLQVVPDLRVSVSFAKTWRARESGQST